MVHFINFSVVSMVRQRHITRWWPDRKLALNPP